MSTAVASMISDRAAVRGLHGHGSVETAGGLPGVAGWDSVTLAVTAVIETARGGMLKD